MARTVLFLGAGASAEAGAPLVSQFVDAIERAHAEGVVERQAYESFLQLRRRAEGNGHRSDDIEDLLRLAEHFGEEALQGLSVVMAETLEARVPFDVQDGMPTSRDPAYRRLAQTLGATPSPSTDLAIVTVNYDVCADVAISDAGLTSYYGLNADRGPAPTEVTLAKLHGSLNWHGCVGTRCGYINAEPHIRESARAQHLTGSGGTMHLWFRRAYTRIVHTCGRPELQPLIVPPVEDKRHYYGDMRVVWDHAEKEIAGAEQLLVAGYSFRPIDRAVNDLLLAAGAGRHIRLLVANPCEETRALIIKRFRDGRTASLTVDEHDTFRSALDALRL